MVQSRSRLGSGLRLALMAVGVLAACHAPKEPKEETRLFPKAPLTRMGPVIHGEQPTAMARLAHLNKPPIVIIPPESVVAPPTKR